MKKTKIGLIALCFLIVCGTIVINKNHALGNPITGPLSGKIIALDAGHGGGDPGAQYPAHCADDNDLSDCKVLEKDVNLAVVYELKKILEADGADVVLTRECDETIISRRERVATAEEKCAILGGECDVLVSVHHNGSDDSDQNGIMVIYNERPEKPLAVYLHDELLKSLFSNDPAYDEGYENGGYGMTVFFTPATITEAYYITNKNEADNYLLGTLTPICSDSDESPYTVHIGNRVAQEVNALYNGLSDYLLNDEPSHPGKRNQ